MFMPCFICLRYLQPSHSDGLFLCVCGVAKCNLLIT